MPGDTWNGHPIPLDASLDELRAMLRQTPPQCWVAIRALGRSPDPVALELLRSELSSSDEFRRRAALEALVESPLRPDARDDVRRLLNDPSPFVVRTAILVAPTFRDENLGAVVRTFLEHPDTPTRHAAIAALSGFWRDEDLETAIAIMTNDPDEDVRKEAAWVIRRHAPADSAALIERWRSSPLPRERVWACDLIAQSENTEYRTTLESLARDSDGHVRAAARKYLAALAASDKDC